MKRISVRVYSADSRAQDKVTSISLPKGICALYCFMCSIPANRADDAVKEKVHDLKSEYIEAYPELGSEGLAEYIRTGLLQEIVEIDQWEYFLDLYEVM